jgi:ribose transport system permease protein
MSTATVGKGRWGRFRAMTPAAVARLIGIFVLVLLLYLAVLSSDPNAASARNHAQLADRIGYFGVLTLGVGILIIAGGIDLSIGSVVGLTAIAFAVLVKEQDVPPVPAMALVLALSAGIGLFHGLLVTRLRLQPFIVTLCGFFIWRGLALWLALPSPLAPLKGLLELISFGLYESDTPLLQGSARDKGLGSAADTPGLEELQKLIATGDVFGVPSVFVLLLLLAAVLGVFLHFTVYGRYLYAIGYNEQAARYAGIAVNRYKVLAYVICSTMAGLGGVLLMLRVPSASASSAGSLYELYAITGAVLGGCSLRGGQGTVVGILLGTAVLPLLRNFVNLAGVQGDLDYITIGIALLAGVVTDELLKRRAARK